jgi:hypothetical protein
VTYKAAPGQNAVRFVRLYLNHNSGVNYYHRFEGIVFDKADYAGTAPDYYMYIEDSRHVYLKDCIIRGTGYTRGDDTTAIYLDTDDFTLDGCTIEGQDESLTCSFMYGFRSTSGSTNITITGCDIRGTWRNMVNGYNWSVTHNTIHDAYQDGIYVEGNNNSGGQQLLIAYNHIYNYFENPQGDHTDLIQFGQTGSAIKNVIIRGNICHDSDHQAWWLNPPSGSGPALIENNLVYNTWMGGDSGNDLHISGNLGDNGTLIVRNNIFDVDMMLTSYRAHFDQITGNIIKNFDLDWDGGYFRTPGPITCDLEDYNIIYRWGSYTDRHTPGAHTITIDSQAEFEALFNDYDNGDYTPAEDAVSIDMVPLSLAPSIDRNEVGRVDISKVGDGKDYADAGCYEYVSGVIDETPPSVVSVNPFGTSSEINFNEPFYVRIPDFSELSGSSSATITFAAKQVRNSQRDSVLWANGNVLIEFGSSENNDLRIRWNLAGNWRNDHTIKNVLDTGIWHHWAFTFNQGTTRIYKDGVKIFTGFDSQTTISANSPDYYIGCRPGFGGFNGLIGEIRICK